MQRRHVLEHAHLFQRVVAHSNRSNLSLFVKPVHRLCCFLYRNQRIRPVNLINIDVIGLQAAQRVIDFLHDPRSSRVAKHLISAPFQPDLGRNDHFFPFPIFRQGSTDELFSASEPIHRSRVDEIYSMLQRRADRFERRLFIGCAPHEATDRPGA